MASTLSWLNCYANVLRVNVLCRGLLLRYLLVAHICSLFQCVFDTCGQIFRLLQVTEQKWSIMNFDNWVLWRVETHKGSIDEWNGWFHKVQQEVHRHDGR